VPAIARCRPAGQIDDNDASILLPARAVACDGFRGFLLELKDELVAVRSQRLSTLGTGAGEAPGL
jgi:hypothetical protein